MARIPGGVGQEKVVDEGGKFMVDEDNWSGEKQQSKLNFGRGNGMFEDLWCDHSRCSWNRSYSVMLDHTAL